MPNRVQRLLGVEGGGFKGRLGASTMVLLPLVAAHTDLPIIAAGGICDATSAAAAGVRLLGRIHDLYVDGDMEASVANTGQVSARITDVRPVAEIVREVWDGAQAALDAGRTRMGA